MRSLTGREFTRLVESRGSTLLRINGSHHIYGKEGERARLFIPVHGSQPLKKGLLRSLAAAGGFLEEIAD